MQALAVISAGMWLVGGAVQAAMPPQLRPMGEAVTFRPFEVTVTGIEAARNSQTVRLTVAYRVRNTSDQPAPLDRAPGLMICDPQGRLYPPVPEAASGTIVSPGAEAELKTRFALPARFDQAIWLVAVGGADGPRIRLY
jgi:hypothetical protein